MLSVLPISPLMTGPLSAAKHNSKTDEIRRYGTGQTGQCASSSTGSVRHSVTGSQSVSQSVTAVSSVSHSVTGSQTLQTDWSETRPNLMSSELMLRNLSTISIFFVHFFQKVDISINALEMTETLAFGLLTVDELMAMERPVMPIACLIILPRRHEVIRWSSVNYLLKHISDEHQQLNIWLRVTHQTLPGIVCDIFSIY